MSIETRIIALVPDFLRPVLRLLYRLPLYYYRDTRNIFRYGYRLAPRSAEMIMIDPREVEYISKTPYHWAHVGCVIAGDWDLDTHPLSIQPKIAICERHFCHGLSWADAGAFEYMATAMKKCPGIDDCWTIEDVEKRYKKLDDLYWSLKNGERLWNPKELGFRWFRENDGVSVHIGRHGSLLFCSMGNHRLAIARILEIPQIPAQVGIVHQLAVLSGTFSAIKRGRK